MPAVCRTIRGSGDACLRPMKAEGMPYKALFILARDDDDDDDDDDGASDIDGEDLLGLLDLDEDLSFVTPFG